MKRIKVLLNEHRIDAYLLVRTTFQWQEFITRFEAIPGSMLRIWRRYASGSDTVQTAGACFSGTSGISAEAELELKRPTGPRIARSLQ